MSIELTAIDQSHTMVDAHGSGAICSECYGCTCHNYQGILERTCVPVDFPKRKKKEQ